MTKDTKTNYRLILWQICPKVNRYEYNARRRSKLGRIMTKVNR